MLVTSCIRGYTYKPLVRRIIYLNNSNFHRNCDMCGQKYELNNREIPRIQVIKKLDLSDINTKDFVAEPDYCDLCIKVIIRFLQRNSELRFRLANRIIVSK